MSKTMSRYYLDTERQKKERAYTQRLFNKIALHLLNQGRRAMGENGCVYRAENGDKCAVGCLIPDSRYDQSIENVGVHALVDPCTYDGVKKNPLTRKQSTRVRLLERLQKIHDCGGGDLPRAEWEVELRDLATECDLNTKAIDKWEKDNAKV